MKCCEAASSYFLFFFFKDFKERKWTLAFLTFEKQEVDFCFNVKQEIGGKLIH